MNKIKDIFYNKNDILIIIVILAVAGLLIWSRIDVIMDYPSKLIASNPPQTGQEEQPTTETPETETPDDTGEPSTTPEAVVMYSVYIESGESLESIANKFVTVGLFESTKEFIQLANEMGITTQIKAGNFIMPSDSTPEEVMNIIIKPGL